VSQRRLEFEWQQLVLDLESLVEDWGARSPAQAPKEQSQASIQADMSLLPETLLKRKKDPLTAISSGRDLQVEEGPCPSMVLHFGGRTMESLKTLEMVRVGWLAPAKVPRKV
jgi:hypothetical protein